MLKSVKHLVNDCFLRGILVNIVGIREKESFKSVRPLTGFIGGNIFDERVILNKHLAGHAEGEEFVRAFQYSVRNKLVGHCFDCQSLGNLQLNDFSRRHTAANRIHNVRNAHVAGKDICPRLQAAGFTDKVNVNLENGFVRNQTG